MKNKLPKEARDFFAECGRRGGSVTSEAKAAAARANGAKRGKAKKVKK